VLQRNRCEEGRAGLLLLAWGVHGLKEGGRGGGREGKRGGWVDMR